jgi:hypothetical protein
LANGLLIGGYFLWGVWGRVESNERLGVTTLMLFNWLAIGIVAAFTIEPQGRYLLHVQPLGVLRFIMGAREFIKAAKGFSLRTLRGFSLRAAAALMVLLQFINVQTGLAYLVDHPYVDADFIAPMIYIKQHQQPGQAVISAIDQVVYVTLGTTDNVYFLAGQTGAARSTRYSYIRPDGSVLDFWLGVPALSGSPDLCRVIYQNPGGWILVDQSRLNASWGFRGNMATIIVGATDVKFYGANNTYAMQIKHEANWSPQAQSLCDSALGILPPPDPTTRGGS